MQNSTLCANICNTACALGLYPVIAAIKQVDVDLTGHAGRRDPLLPANRSQMHARPTTDVAHSFEDRAEFSAFRYRLHGPCNPHASAAPASDVMTTRTHVGTLLRPRDRSGTHAKLPLDVAGLMERS